MLPSPLPGWHHHKLSTSTEADMSHFSAMMGCLLQRITLEQRCELCRHTFPHCTAAQVASGEMGLFFCYSLALPNQRSPL